MRSLAVVLLSCVAPLGVDRADADESALGDRLLVQMNDWSNAVGGGLREVTFDLVDMRFDLRRQTARFGLGGGPLRFDSDIVIRGDGWARVRAGFDLTVGGTCVKLQLPAIDVAPQDVNGESALVVRLPIIESSF